MIPGIINYYEDSEKHLENAYLELKLLKKSIKKHTKELDKLSENYYKTNADGRPGRDYREHVFYVEVKLLKQEIQFLKQSLDTVSGRGYRIKQIIEKKALVDIPEEPTKEQ